mgnify:CR=1 FL=1
MCSALWVLLGDPVVMRARWLWPLDEAGPPAYKRGHDPLFCDHSTNYDPGALSS